MASISGLQNNPTNNLNTIDGLQIINATSIYDNGVLIDTTNLVPYTGATQTIDAGAQNIQTTHVPLTVSDVTNKGYVDFAVSTGSGDTLGIVDLNYVRYTGSHDNVDLASNNLTVGNAGQVSFSNIIKTQLNNVLTSYNPASITVGNNFGTITNVAGVYQSTSSAVFASLVLGTFTSGNKYSISLTLKSVDVSNNTNLYLYGSTTTNFSGNTGQLVAFSIPPNTTTFTTFTNTITFPASSTYLLLVYYSQKPSGIDTLYWNAYTVAGMGSVIQNLIAPSSALDATNKNYVDTATSALVPYTGATANVNLGSNSITATTAKFTSVISATPALALGVDVSGNLNTFAVPTATNILPLNNTFTGTNTFNNNVINGSGYTTDINGVIQTKLNSLGFSSASFTTSGITGVYTPPLGTITNVSGSTYQIAQTAQGRSIMAISGFTPTVQTTYVFQFNIKCTVGTATISVEQDNILRSPALYPLSTGFNTVTGTFTYDGTSNTVVFKIYTGVSSWNAQWDSFTLSTYSISANANVSASGSNKFIQSYNATTGDTTTLVNRQTMDSALALKPDLLPLSNVWTGATNSFNFDVSVGGALGVRGNIVKQTASALSYATIGGGNATNSPYMEFITGGTSRGYIGDATSTDVNIVAQNGAQLNFWTAGTKRLNIDTSGNLVMNIQKALYLYFISATNNAGLITNASGDVSIFTGTGGVSNRLTITAGGETVVPSIYGYGQFRAIAGNYGWFIRNDGADTYFLLTASGDQYGIWNGLRPFRINNSSGRVTMDNNLTVNGGNYVFGSIPQNNYDYAHVVCLEGDTMRRSQCMMRQVYFNQFVSWGGGVNITYAFYKYNSTCPVRISGKYAMYSTYVGLQTFGIRIYSQNSGVYRYYSLITYQNISIAQTTYPIDLIFSTAQLPELGWYDIYIYNAGGCSTDGNDQLLINVELLPVNSF